MTFRIFVMLPTEINVKLMTFNTSEEEGSDIIVTGFVRDSAKNTNLKALQGTIF